MFDPHGPLQHVDLSPTLWLIPFLPLAAAAHIGWLYLTRNAQPRAVARSSILGVFGALVMIAYHAAKLAALAPSDRFLLQHLWRLARFGQLDANLDLAFDPLAAALSLAAALVTSVVVLNAVLSAEIAPRLFAGACLLLGSALLLFLGDDFAVTLIGWEGVSVALWVLVGAASLRTFLVHRAGDASLLLGAALVFWTLGGTWSGPDYIPDLNARFSAIAVRDAADDTPSRPAVEDEDDEGGRAKAPAGMALLTFTSYPGSIVYADDARTPLLRPDKGPLRAPFVRFPIESGRHSFRIHAGRGLDDYLVSHVSMGAGDEVALTPFGSTLTFRAMKDGLVARREPGDTPRAAREELASRSWGGASAIAVACIFLFIAAAVRTAQLPFGRWLVDATLGPAAASVLASCVAPLAGVYLVARTGFLFAISPATSGVVAAAGAITAVCAAAAAIEARDLRRILGFHTVSTLGLVVLGLGVGAYTSALVLAVTHALAKGVLLLGCDEREARPGAARAAWIACFASSFPGAFLTLVHLAVTSVSGSALSRGGVAVAALASIALGTFALFRSYFSAFRASKPIEAPSRPSAPVRMLAALADTFAEQSERATVASVLAVRSVVVGMDLWVIDSAVFALAAVTRAAAWITARADLDLVDRAPSAAASGALRAIDVLVLRNRAVLGPRTATYFYVALAAAATIVVLRCVLS